MESKYQEYSLLAVSRFNVYILEKFFEENTFFQKIYILKSQNAIQAATITSISASQHSCRVIVASKTTLWSIYLPVGEKEDNTESKRPSKRRKLDDTSADSEDIFAELLGEKNTTNLEDVNLFQEELSTQQHVFALCLNDKQRLHILDSKIVDIAVSEEILVALVVEEETAYIKVFVLGDGKARCIQSIPTEIGARFFNSEPVSSYLAKQLYLVVHQHLQEASKVQATGGRLSLATNLFTLLFGKEAACLRSPVVLLCDIKGCLYFCQTKSLEPQPKRLRVLCETNSPVVAISRMEFNSWPKEEMYKNGETIAQLESALGNVNMDAKREALPVTGLVVTSETGQCCMFLPNEFARDALIFYLPHSTHSCIVKGSHILYSTETTVEVCDVIITRQEDNDINVAVIKKMSFCCEWMTRLVSVSKIFGQEKDVIIGISNELKLVQLPISQDKAMRPPHSDSTMNILLDSDLKCITDFFEDTRSAQTLIDSCLLQLNLFASLIKQQRALLHHQFLKNEDIIVTCKCDILSKPSIPFIWFQVLLTNNTNVLFTQDWTVDVNVDQKAAPRHFVIPLPHGLPPKSTKEIIIPVPSPSVPNLRPYGLSVTLILTPNVTLSTIKTLPSHFNQPLVVKIYEECFDVMDYLQLTSSTDSAISYRRPDEPCSFLQGNNSVMSGELVKCLSSIPRIRSARNLVEEVHAGGGSSPTFAITLLVSEVLCIEHHLETAVDVVKLILAAGSNKDTKQLLQPLVQFKTPCENIPVTVAVAENSVSLTDCLSSSGAKQEQKPLAFMVTLRSSHIALLLATRDAIKKRLKKQSHTFIECRDVIPLPSKVKLKQQLQRIERLFDELMIKRDRKSVV